MANRIEIRSLEEFKRWLEGKPVTWAQVVSTRAALRVLPLAVRVLRARMERGRQEQLLLQAFRTSHIAWAACRYPAVGIARSIQVVKYAGEVTEEWGAYGEHNAPIMSAVHVYVARAAMNAATANAADAVGAAADAASVGGIEQVAFWRALSRDTNWLASSGSANLIDQALWLAGDSPAYAVSLDVWVRQAWDELNGAFAPWIAWYNALLPSGGSASARDLFGKTLSIRIAAQSDDWWIRSASEISGDIEKWLRGEGTGDSVESELPPPAPELGNDVAVQEDRESDLGTLTGSPLPDSDERAGSKLHIERDVRQYVLDVDTYAEALAIVFRYAVGEFCFAVFGPWGRGKTVLARCLERRLSERDQEREEEKQRYATVFFSAWKYRRTPETWLFLYETFAEKFKSGGTWTRVVRTIRSGVERHGYWSLILSLVVTLATALPFVAALNIASAIASLVGWIGLLYAIGFFGRATQTIDTLSRRYARLSSHKEKLGLQALIGDDLRALLLGWIPRGRNPTPNRTDNEVRQRNVEGDGQSRNGRIRNKRSLLLALSILGLSAAVWLLALFGQLPIGQSVFAVSCSASPSTAPLCDFLSSLNFSSNKAVPMLLFAIWAAICVVVVYAVHFHRRDIDRILLVIDDLDRCTPTEAIDVVEAIKLLLEDDEISQRLQVLILADEAALKHGIAVKFASLIKDRREAAGVSSSADAARDKAEIRQNVLREHLEKIFTCHLRMCGLSRNDVASLMASYTQPVLSTTRSADSAANNTSNDIGPRPQPSAPRVSDARASNRPVDAAPRTTEARPAERAPLEPRLPRDNNNDWALVWSEFELEKLRVYFRDYFTNDDKSMPSPRTLRTFLFKYQLCRLLVQLYSRNGGEEPATPTQIIDSLAHKCFARKNMAGEPFHGPPALKAFIEQVI